MKRLLLILMLLSGSVDATDYFFGGDTTGTVELQFGNEHVITQKSTTPANSGTLDSAIGWLHGNNNGPFTVVFVVYKVSDSSLVDSTSEVTVPDDYTENRYSAPFQLGATVDASTEYFVGWLAYGGTGNIRGITTDDNAVTYVYDDVNTSVPDPISASFDGTGNDSFKLGYFYSDGASPTVIKNIGKVTLGKGSF